MTQEADGLSQQEAVQKLLSLEMSEDSIQSEMKKIFKRVGWDGQAFSAIRPVREFMLGWHDKFDEYEIQSDFENAHLLSKLHPALQGYALILYMFAVNKSALTRSRNGNQQINLRSYYGHSSQLEQRKDGSWTTQPMKSRRRGE